MISRGIGVNSLKFENLRIWEANIEDDGLMVFLYCISGPSMGKKLVSNFFNPLSLKSWERRFTPLSFLYPSFKECLKLRGLFLNKAQPTEGCRATYRRQFVFKTKFPGGLVTHLIFFPHHESQRTSWLILFFPIFHLDPPEIFRKPKVFFLLYQRFFDVFRRIKRISWEEKG